MFFIMTIPFYNLTSNVQGSPYPCQCLLFSGGFDSGHFSGCEVVSHRGFFFFNFLFYIGV